MSYAIEAEGLPVTVYKSKFGGWRLKDANGNAVVDEHGEPWEYATEAEATSALRSFIDERR